MTTVSSLYGSWTAITCTTTSLVQDASLLAGRQSAGIDNSSTLADDAMFGGTIATTSTNGAAGVIEVWIGAINDGTNFTYNAAVSAGLTTDANLSLATSGVKSLGYLATVIQHTDTTARTYYVGPINLVQTMGFMPQKWFLYIVHNTNTSTGVLGATTLKYANINYSNA